MTAAEWSGTPAEWDAERERKRKRVAEYFEGSSYATIDAVMSCMESLFPMPPRPVEPPYTCMECGIADDAVLVSGAPANPYYAHVTASVCRIALKDAIRALRDGPTARYEVCGWGVVWKDGTSTQGWSTSRERDAHNCATTYGGTAHAIYKRVGGE